jgi:hypothetical protein
VRSRARRRRSPALQQRSVELRVLERIPGAPSTPPPGASSAPVAGVRPHDSVRTFSHLEPEGIKVGAQFARPAPWDSRHERTPRSTSSMRCA